MTKQTDEPSSHFSELSAAAALPTATHRKVSDTKQALCLIEIVEWILDIFCSLKYEIRRLNTAKTSLRYH